MTSTSERRVDANGCVVFDEALTLESTIYRSSSGKLQEKLSKFVLKVPGKPTTTLSCTFDLSEHAVGAESETSSSEEFTLLEEDAACDELLAPVLQLKISCQAITGPLPRLTPRLRQRLSTQDDPATTQHTAVDAPKKTAQDAELDVQHSAAHSVHSAAHSVVKPETSPLHAVTPISNAQHRNISTENDEAAARLLSDHFSGRCGSVSPKSSIGNGASQSPLRVSPVALCATKAAASPSGLHKGDADDKRKVMEETWKELEATWKQMTPRKVKRSDVSFEVTQEKMTPALEISVARQCRHYDCAITGA